MPKYIIQKIFMCHPNVYLDKNFDDYWKNSGSLWQNCRDELHNDLTDSESFQSKTKIIGNTPAVGNTKNVEIAIPLKYLSSFWRTLEASIINCDVNLILKWSSSVITNSTSLETIAITDTKLYIPVATLSAQYNAKPLQQLKCGFKKNN